MQFSWWSTNFRSLLILFPSSIRLLRPWLPEFSWIPFTTFTACRSPSYLTEIRSLQASSGSYSFDQLDPASASVHLPTRRRMARRSASISAWKHTCIVSLTPARLNGVVGYLLPNFGTTLQLTQLWVVHRSRSCMSIHHDTLGWMLIH